MNLDKVIAAIKTASTELATAVTAERKALADPKASLADISKAGPALQLAGVIDSALTNLGDSITKSAEAGKVVGSLKALSKVRKPKAKKAKAAAAGK